MLFLFIIIAILAVIGWLLFSFNAFGMILTIVFCVEGVILRLAAPKRGQILSVILIIPIIVVTIFCGSTGYMWTDYNSQLIEIGKTIDKGNLNEAKMKLNSIKKEYGGTDKEKMMRAYLHTKSRKYDEALSEIDSIKNKNSEEWFRCKESVYTAMNADNRESQLKSLYKDAVVAFPKSAYFNMMEGVSCLQEDRLNEAFYYLSRANKLNGKVAVTSFYLGVTRFKQMHTNEAKKWFNKAEALGLSKSLKKQADWYRKAIKEQEK